MSASSTTALLLSAVLIGPPGAAPPVEGAPPAETAPAPAEAAPPEATPAEAAPAEAPGSAAEANGWDDAGTDTAAEPAPASDPAPQPEPPTTTTTVIVNQPPAQQDKPPPPRSRVGRGLVAGGATLVGLGGVSLLFIAVPAAIVKSVAINRAEDDALLDVEDRRTHYRRAATADDVMEGAFWTGVVMVGVGIPLLIAGTVVRNRARAEVAQRLQLDASGVTVRF